VIEAVYLDIGETILDRSREHAAAAAACGVSAHTFSAVFGAIIAAGGTVADVHAAFGMVAPAATRVALRETDLFPHARAAMALLRRDGRFVGVAGNQTSLLAAQLRALALPADDVVASAELGLAKPDPRFFEALASRCRHAPASIVYVGDQLDNDVVAAVDAGLHAVRVLTGPWGRLCRNAQIERRCLAVIDTLAELPDVLRTVDREELPNQRSA
jgi:FMN phosphatase YigB (HAD superfamily)